MGGSGAIRIVGELAARQQRLVTRRQLPLSPRVIDRLVAEGYLHRIHAGVFAVGHPVLAPVERWRAATLALGPTAVLSHRSAASLWGILPPSESLEVTVPTTAGRRHRDGIRVHRRRVRDEERTIRDEVPTTTLARTIADLAAVADRDLPRAFEEAQVRHRLSPAVLGAALVADPSRRGSRALRALLAGAVEPGQVESILELRFLRLCADHGLPRPLTQVRFGPWRVDFWFPQARLAVETDGARYHATARAQARDAAKSAALEAAGVQLLRLRWAEITARPAQTAERVAASGR